MTLKLILSCEFLNTLTSLIKVKSLSMSTSPHIPSKKKCTSIVDNWQALSITFSLLNSRNTFNKNKKAP